MRFITVVILFFSFQSLADSTFTNFNMEIIERLARTETKTDEGLKYIQMQLDGQKSDIHIQYDNQKKDIDSKFYMNMAVLLALFGFIYWDRRTALLPIEKENLLLKEKYKR